MRQLASEAAVCNHAAWTQMLAWLALKSNEICCWVIAATLGSSTVLHLRHKVLIWESRC